MQRIRPRASLLAGGALIAASLGVAILGAGPASAVPADLTMGCTASALSGNPPPTVPFEVTIDGGAPSAAFPSGQSVVVDDVDVSITMPGVVVGSLRNTFGDNGSGLRLGVAQGIVGIAATNASPATRLNSASAMTAASVAVTGYVPDPDGSGPAMPMADPITWHVEDVPYAAFTSDGTAGDTMEFRPSSPGSGLIVSLTNHANFTFMSTTGFGTLNAGPNPGPGPGTCHDLVAASGPFATTNLGDVPPTVNAATFPAIGGIDNALLVTGSSADATGIDAATWAATVPTCGAGSASVVVDSGSTSGAQLTFSAPASTTTCTFDVTVADTAGNVSDPATMTVEVTAGGDGLSQDVVQVVAAGVLDLEACGSSNPDPSDCAITLSPVQLDGDPHTSTGAIRQLTVADARGGPAPWTLTATMPADLRNADASLTGQNASIAAERLTLSGAACAPEAGNLNGEPTAGSGGSLDEVVTICSAGAGSNTGGFTADAALTLDVPSSTYAGTYVGTINFIVQ